MRQYIKKKKILNIGKRIDFVDVALNEFQSCYFSPVFSHFMLISFFVMLIRITNVKYNFCCKWFYSYIQQSKWHNSHHEYRWNQLRHVMQRVI